MAKRQSSEPIIGETLAVTKSGESEGEGQRVKNYRASEMRDNSRFPVIVSMPPSTHTEFALQHQFAVFGPKNALFIVFADLPVRISCEPDDTALRLY